MDKFYLQGTDAEKERFSGVAQVNFEWNIVYACNYRCPHCIFEGKWEEYGKRTAYLPVAEWMRHWRRIHERYGRCSILVTGGEPFVYPGFIELMKELSAVHYPVNISTNSSGDLKRFVREIDPLRVSLSLSFQPGFDTIEAVLERAAFLRTHGFAGEFINLCAYPPYLAELDRYVAAAGKAGEMLKVIPFYGSYHGKNYPDAYDPAEKKMLGMDGTWERNVKRKGTLCAAGQKSALIFPDGKVARCGQIGERIPVGIFFDDNFRLLERPQACDVDLCPCLKAVDADETERS